MISLAQLWIPIVLSAVLVFAASSLIHMVFKWHNPDYRKLANEDEVRAAIRSSSPAPGQYMIPHCIDPKEMQKAEVQQKYKDGPVGFLMLRPAGAPSMGTPLALTLRPKPGSGCTRTDTLTVLVPNVMLGERIERVSVGSGIVSVNVACVAVTLSRTEIEKGPPATAFAATEN